jgi:single-stranded DNA-binding protein
MERRCVMSGFATVKIEGQLFKDPELRYRPEGTPCATLCVRVSRANGYEKSVVYVECKQVGDQAEDTAAEYKKGDAVRIEGNLAQRRWSHGGQDYSRLIVDVASMERAA